VANKRQLEILKAGVEEWNAWRAKQPPDFAASLQSADLLGAEIQGANLTWADLSRANLVQTNLVQANLRSANLTQADLRGADLRLADLTSANLQRTILAFANLREAKLRSLLSQTDLSGANLAGADLRRANLSGVNLSEADLTGADLRDASLWGVRLDRVILTAADLAGAKLSLCVLSETDLSRAKGLDSVIFEGPCEIGVQTLVASTGKIPASFLRGAGVPEPFITNLDALIGAMAPIQFYSCFISYSSRDEEFAERLHAGLQARQVRCWFAPEDLKIGDRFRQRIDEAIRVHDKLLLILTEHSVSSAWVESEVEGALEKERRQKRTVLFPIRLDDAVLDSDRAWAADLRRTRHIGDFRRWKDHDAYKQAFDRLLRDLQCAAE
jgi:uncharacterized protein YjbI with pentapeptide repeats